MKNLTRSLTTWLEDNYCSITVTNHRLITIIRFIAKSYIHLWKSFVNKFYLVLHAEPKRHVPWGTKQGVSAIHPNQALIKLSLFFWKLQIESLYYVLAERERESLYYGQIGLIQCNNQSNCKLLSWVLQLSADRYTFWSRATGVYTTNCAHARLHQKQWGTEVSMQGWPNTACRPGLLQSASVKLRKSDV